MQTVLLVLQGLAGLGVLVCHILVIVRMFQAGDTGMGILCIVLSFCGIGFLVTLIYGWVKAPVWGITKLMTIFTGLFVADILLGGLAFATGAPIPGLR
jgi:hypothetical protein